MQTIMLNQEDINKLNALLQEMPLKFGLPILNVLEAAAQRDFKKEEEE